MTNLFKKFGVKEKGAKPGDLLTALNASKGKKGGVQGLFKKHSKVSCKQCSKFHSKGHKHMKVESEKEENDKFNREASREEKIKEKKEKKRKNISGALHTAKRESHKEKRHAKHKKEHSSEAIKGIEKFAREEAKEKKHGKHKKVGPQQPVGSGPMVGSVGGFKKHGKKGKK